MAGISTRAHINCTSSRLARPDVAGYVSIGFDRGGNVVVLAGDVRGVPNRAQAISQAGGQIRRFLETGHVEAAE